MKTIRLVAKDISCQHCVMAIKRELAGAEDVRVLDIDLPSKVVTLEYSSQAALERARSAMAEIGYPTEPEA